MNAAGAPRSSSLATGTRAWGVYGENKEKITNALSAFVCFTKKTQLASPNPQ